MKRQTKTEIDNFYTVLVEGLLPHEVEPDLYGEDSEPLDIFSGDYINRLGTEFGERVIYWEEDYDPSAYRLGENDGDKERAIIDALEECGIEFDTDLVKKYPKDYEGRCPKCGGELTEHPAISREDNKTEICPKCGAMEAIKKFKENCRKSG